MVSRYTAVVTSWCERGLRPTYILLVLSGEGEDGTILLEKPDWYLFWCWGAERGCNSLLERV